MANIDDFKLSIENILVKFGELNAERRHREEESSKAEVFLFRDPAKNFSYFMRWHCGNKIEIIEIKIDNWQLSSVAMLDATSFENRPIAIATAIHGILEGLDKRYY